jgi:predicted PurR-regulated permease PerM
VEIGGVQLPIFQGAQWRRLPPGFTDITYAGLQAMNTALQKTAAPPRALQLESAPQASVPVPAPEPVTAPTETSVIHIPVNARGVALAILATVAFVFALQWAQKFFIPLVFSILLSYTLTPVVSWLERIRIPRLVASAMVLLVLLGGVAVVANSLRSEFQSILTRLPSAAHQISQAIDAAQDGEPSMMQKMQAVATEIEKATSQSPGSRQGARVAPAGVVMAAPTFKVQDWLWAGSMGAAGVVGQATMVLFLIFFLLLSGDSFKRKLVKITGPSLSNKKITVHILDDINKSLQGYMFMLLVTNLLLGAMLWVVFRLVGLENAGAWAIAAACPSFPTSDR